jgi:16S rRNA (adenine1518-N6/adenine1519-N6)-dimethyltransferase
MAQTLSQIKDLLNQVGQRPKRALGQNFLHDGNQMDRIMEAARLTQGDVVLEVGAGTGALSERLLEAGADLLAVELDDGLIRILRQRLESWGERVSLLHADALASKHEVNPEIWRGLIELSHRRGRPPDGFKLVANLPYQVASPLLIHLAQRRETPWMTRGVAMVQKEVADRLTAEPAGKEYGPLGIIVGAFCKVQRIARLPPSCFWPAPSVDSAVVLLERRRTPLPADPSAFVDVVHRLFAQRRKQIGRLFREPAARLGSAGWPEGIGPELRPEQLSMQQLVALADRLAERSRTDADGAVDRAVDGHEGEP